MVLGGGILATIAAGSRVRAPGVARVFIVAMTVGIAATVAMTVDIAATVSRRGGDYNYWNRWSLGAFVLGALGVLVGTFVPVVLVGGVLFIFAGFTLRLGYEVWRVRADYSPDRSLV